MSDWPTDFQDRASGLTDFAKLIEGHNGLWLSDMQLKYLTVHIDTRSAHFTIRDRDGNRISPDRVVRASQGKHAKTVERTPGAPVIRAVATKAAHSPKGEDTHRTQSGNPETSS